MTHTPSEAMRRLLALLDNGPTASRMLTESFDDWNTGEWVHYSRIPELKINRTRPLHQDPLGLYFFPASFSPEGQWRTFRYRFTVRLKPGVRILDFAAATKDQWEAMLAAVGGQGLETYRELERKYPTDDPKKIGDRVWDCLRETFGYGVPAMARWNTFLRQQGYDAVFDDTGAILNNEVQLLVLNPRMIQVVSKDRRSGEGFAEVEMIRADIKALAERMGLVVTDEQPTRRKVTHAYDGTSVTLEGSLYLRNPEDPEDNYANIRLYTRETAPGEIPKTAHASIRWSTPSLGYGSGVQYSIARGAYADLSSGDPLAGFERDLRKIFSPQGEP